MGDFNTMHKIDVKRYFDSPLLLISPSPTNLDMDMVHPCYDLFAL